MSVARARLLEPLSKIDVPLTHAALIVGGGIAGMTAAGALGDMGHEVHLVESASPDWAAAYCRWDRTIRGNDPAQIIADLEQRLIDDPNVHIYLESELVDFHGFVGNFSSVVQDKDGRRTSIDHGVIIVATGAREDRVDLYGLDRRPEVVTEMDFERMLKEDDRRLAEAKSIGFILCAGSLEEGHPYCSRICCQHGVKNAIELKERDPSRAGLRVVQRDAHLRPAGGVLHQGPGAGRHLHPLCERRQDRG